MLCALISSSCGLGRHLSSSGSSSSRRRLFPGMFSSSRATDPCGLTPLHLAAASFSSRIHKSTQQQKARRGGGAAQQQQRQRQRQQQRQGEQTPTSAAAVEQAAEAVAPSPAPHHPTSIITPAPLSRIPSPAPPPRGLLPSTLLPLDLGTYHTLLSRASTMPSEALVLLQDMHELGLTVDPPALLSALRVCGRHPAYLQESLKLHAQVLGFPSLCSSSSSSSFSSSSPPSLLQNNNSNNAPAIVESYALILSACLRAGGLQGHDAASFLLEQMKEEKIAPTLVMYRELAQACLVVIEEEEEGREEGGGREGGRAMEVFREVVAMVPAGEEGGGGGRAEAETQAADGSLISSSPSSSGNGKRLTVKCKSEGEARWVQQLLATKAAGDVEQALLLLAQGLTAFCCSSGREGGREGGKEGEGEKAGAFACNVVLSTCIKAERWKAAGQVKDLMQGLQVSPDAFTLNSLLAHSLRQHHHHQQQQQQQQHQQQQHQHQHQQHQQQQQQQQQDHLLPSLSSALPPLVLIKEVLSAFPSLAPNPNTFRAILDVCGVEELLDLCQFMQGREGGREGGGEGGVGVGVGVGTYRLLLQALERREGGEGVRRKGLPLLARVEEE